MEHACIDQIWLLHEQSQINIGIPYLMDLTFGIKIEPNLRDQCVKLQGYVLQLGFGGKVMLL